MDPYQEHLRLVSFHFYKRTKKYCRDLFEYFDLNEFWYYRISNTGSYMFLGSEPGFDEYFASNKYYLNNPYFCHPKYFQSGLSLQESVQNKAVSHLVDFGKKKFNFHNTMFLIQKNLNEVECFGFSSSRPDQLHLTRIVNELPLIELFTKKFKEDNGFIISKLKDNQIDLSGILGSEFYKKPVPIMSQKQSAKKSFLKSLGIDSNLFSLTPKERKVLELLSKGLSARQIAERLHRSKRTVEHHIERIKDKTCYSSRAELIEKAKELEMFEITYM